MKGPFILLMATTLVLAQQMPTEKPEDLARLNKDEIVRIYRKGGLTQRGAYWSLIVVKKNLKVFVKSVNGSLATKMSGRQKAELESAIKSTNWSAMTATKRSGPSPSAWDGTDIYLSYREGTRVRNWSNARFDYSGTVPILEVLESY